MAESHHTNSIASIIAVGLNLATTLDTIIASQRHPEQELCDLAGDISATTGILRQLQQLVEDYEKHKGSTQGQLTILKDAGIQEINYRVTQCEILYRTTIANTTKAGLAGWKNHIKVETIDTSVLKATSFWRGVRWSWLEPRFKKSLEQIQVVKMNLLLILQVANLAKHQFCTVQRIPGMFEEEMALRNLVERLKRRRYGHIKDLAKKYYVSPPSTANSSLVDLLHADVLTREEQVLLKLISGKWSWAQIRQRFNIEFSQALTIRTLQMRSRRIQETIRKKNAKSKDDCVINVIEGIENGVAKKPVPSQGNTSNSIEEIVVLSGGGSSKPPPYAESSGVQKDVPTFVTGKLIEEPVHKLGSVFPPPPPPPVPVEIKKLASEQINDIDVVIDSSHPIIKEKLREVDIITMSAFKKQFGKVDSWFKELFGPSSLFFDDQESENLEAFMILGDKKRLKVPFGHRRLKFGMKRLMKTKKASTLDDYYVLPKHLQVAISNVLLVAKIKDSRERVVVCFDVLSLGDKVEDQHLLVFFSANGPPLEPIRFIDAVARKFVVPYHLIQTWDEMKNMVNSAFLHVDVIGPHVRDGHFDLLNDDDEIILPTCWEGIIQPGMKIKMHMWPVTESNRQRPGAPGWGPPPMPRPNTIFPPPGFRPPPPPGARPKGPAPGPGPGPGPTGWLGRPGPPPPTPLPPYPNAMRRRSYCSYTSVYDSDSSVLGSCSDIDNEVADEGLQMDYQEEKKNAKVEVKDLLEKWTNAIDVEAGPLGSSSFSSSSGSMSDSSLVDD